MRKMASFVFAAGALAAAQAAQAGVCDAQFMHDGGAVQLTGTGNLALGADLNFAEVSKTNGDNCRARVRGVATFSYAGLPPGKSRLDYLMTVKSGQATFVRYATAGEAPRPSEGQFDLRMLGVARGVSLRALHRLIPFGVAGFATSAITGFLFVVSAPDQYLYNPALQTKLALMGLAGVNMVLFYATAARAASSTNPDDLPPMRARLFGVVSLGCWLGVIACGRVITAFRPPWYWCWWC